jgi:hypothetical protein
MNSGTPSVRFRICSRRTGGSALPPADARHERRVVASSKPGQRQRRDMGLTEARRLELRPIGENEQRRQAVNTLDEDVEELARRRIDPMRILEQNQYRLSCGDRGESRRQAVEQQLLAALATERERRIRIADGDRHQLGDQRDVARGIPGKWRDEPFDLPQLGGIIVGGQELGGMFELRDDGV